jgi:hypothetical protein
MASTLTVQADSPGAGSTRPVYARGGRAVQLGVYKLAFGNPYVVGGEDVSAIWNDFKDVLAISVAQSDATVADRREVMVDLPIFISPHGHYRATIVAADYEIVRGNQRRRIPGLAAQFESGIFDSEKAQRELRWSDEDRKFVEDELMLLNDFGKPSGFYLADPGIETPGTSPESFEPDFDAISALAGEQGVCQVVFQTPEGAVPCGKKAVSESPYCRQHISLAERAGV